MDLEKLSKKYVKLSYIYRDEIGYNRVIFLRRAGLGINKIRQFFYALYLTNSFGWRLKRTADPKEKKRLRLAYSQKQLGSLNISVMAEGLEKIVPGRQYLLLCNHRSIIDPPIIEVALAYTDLFGLWISKKELYDSFFFGLFVRNAGTILLDREQSQMSGFFADVKAGLAEGDSIFIFPEGTRNKTDDPLLPFKEGSRIIAMKNRLPMLPVYIRENAGKVLSDALDDNSVQREITVVFGDEIDYKERGDLQRVYGERFNLSL